jgi:hypothetical protein
MHTRTVRQCFQNILTAVAIIHIGNSMEQFQSTDVFSIRSVVGATSMYIEGNVHL